jgi:hypothetical protein
LDRLRLLHTKTPTMTPKTITATATMAETQAGSEAAEAELVIGQSVLCMLLKNIIC